MRYCYSVFAYDEFLDNFDSLESAKAYRIHLINVGSYEPVDLRIYKNVPEETE